MDDPRAARWPPVSRPARHLYYELLRRGGVARIPPLLRARCLPPEDLLDAINELAERCRITITLRPPRDRDSVALTEVERITLTAFSRRHPLV